MTFTYATPAELAAWLDPDAEEPEIPALATVLLRSASQLVLDATKGAVYRATPEGKPTELRLLTAMQQATMEQAAVWSLNGIDPRKGAGQTPRRVASKSLNGASVSYVADPNSDTYLSDLATGKALVSSAWLFIDNAGLTSNQVQIADRYVRPLDRVNLEGYDGTVTLTSDPDGTPVLLED